MSKESEKHIDFTVSEQKLLSQLSIGEGQKVKNPYSGVECELSKEATALYDFIMGSSISNVYVKGYNKAIDMFLKYWPEAYMKLID